jgi:hypothetical protein
MINIIAFVQNVYDMGVIINHINCMRTDSANLPILAAHNNTSEPIADTDFVSITNMIKTERDAKVLYV